MKRFLALSLALFSSCADPVHAESTPTTALARFECPGSSTVEALTSSLVGTWDGVAELELSGTYAMHMELLADKSGTIPLYAMTSEEQCMESLAQTITFQWEVVNPTLLTFKLPPRDICARGSTQSWTSVYVTTGCELTALSASHLLPIDDAVLRLEKTRE